MADSSEQSTHPVLHKCPKCDRTFANIGHMKCHFYRVHPEFKLAEFEMPEGATTIHHQEKPEVILEIEEKEPSPATKQMPLSKIQQLLFKCDKCSKCFAKKTSLLKHAISNHGDQRPFQCSICDKCFPSEARLKTHEGTHEINPPCRECAKTPSKTRCTHRKKKRYVCKVCKRGFLYRSCLKTHEQTHKEDEEDSEEVEDEEAEQEDQEEEEELELRNEGRSYSSYQRKVVSRTPAAKLKCEICSKTFSRPCNLARHAVTHKFDDDQS